MSVETEPLGAARTDAPGATEAPPPWWIRRRRDDELLADPADDLDGGERDLAAAWRVLSFVVVAASCALVLWQMHPALLLRNTTANGGDMGAHVWFPAFLRDSLLPHWRVAGWSNDYFAGFPAGQFYFPLPALLIVALDLVAPYDVAFKVVTALGVVAMPAAAYVFARGLRFRRPAPELFAVATTIFLYFKGVSGSSAHADTMRFNQRIMGGPIVSTLAGEFSFAIALTLALFALGTLADALTRRRRFWLPAVLLACAVLSHIVVGIFAVVGALVIVVTRHPRRSVLLGVAIGAVAAALTAFWSVPLLATFGYTANMRYERLTWYVDYLFLGGFWWAYLLGAVALVAAIVTASRPIVVLAAITGIFGIIFRFWPELHAWNLRFLPFWYLGILLLAAAGAAELVRLVARLVGQAWVTGDDDSGYIPTQADVRADRRLGILVRVITAGLAVALLAGVVLYVDHDDRGYLDFWAEWNYSGYQDVSATSAKPKAWPEYERLMQTMDGLPAGRAMWEGGQALDAYGTPLSLMLLPYFTDGRISSMEGLYYESAATTPYHFMAVATLSGPGNASNPVRGLDYRDINSFDLGVRYLQALGVRYYMAYSTEAKAKADANPELRLVRQVPDLDGQPPSGWNIYEVRGSALVAPLGREPVVVEAHPGRQSECFGRKPAPGVKDPELDAWECTAVGWWSDAGALDRPLAAGGPASWTRVPASRARAEPSRPLPPVTVSQVRETDNSISFHVDRVGVPVVVRTSYFPNWSAHGAQGPWRLTPNFMVVVPTRRDVSLHYDRTGAEWLGFALSLAGLAGLGGLVVWGRRQRRERAEGPPATPEGRGYDVTSSRPPAGNSV